MTEEFLGGSSGITKVEFSERKKYLEQIQKMDVEFLDTLYDKRLYGFVNKNYEVVAPISNPVLFGQYAGVTPGMSHTVSIFNKFREFYFNLVSDSGRISIPDPIKDLKPSKSFVDFDNAYHEFIRTAALVLSQRLQDEGANEETSFANFATMLNAIIFKPSIKKYKLTKSGYALSEFSSVFHTGLYIDLGSDYDPHLDQMKVELVTHPDFLCFAKHALMFGMNVDFNCPWRLVVDLDSPTAQENILNGRTTANFRDFYSDLYTVKVAYDDFWALKSFYELLFLQLKTDLGVESVPTNFSNLSTESWIKIFLINRFKELGLLHEPNQTTTLFEETLFKAVNLNRINGLGGPSGVLGFVNSFSAQTLKFIMEGV